MKQARKLAGAALAAVLIFSSARSIAQSCCMAGEEEQGWKSLFDGRTLRGWIQRGGKAKYVVEDGAIVGITVPGTPNSFLCTEETFGDFILELDFKVDEGLNSGIQIRSNSYPWYRNGRVHGYQVEIDPSERAWTGGIYDEARRGWLFPLKNNPKARAAFKHGRWNHFRIEAVGDHIVTYLNGVKAADLRDSLTARGFIGLQVHATRTPGLKVRWKNIRIKVLDEPIEIRVLIIDGENNHNWRATTPVLKEILEDAGIFRVDVATTPKDVSKFKPDFSRYDVVLSNYNGRAWPEETKKAFVRFIRNGGGLVVVHAADNAFPDWPEYNEMIGLGGWGGRNEKWGPMVYWEGGKLIRDTRPGRAGSHGKQWPYLVVVRNPLHPITWGLPGKWRHVADELYSELRGPAENLTLLATAWADPKTGGTGRHEPVLFTVTYGKGRIFHTTMGHGPKQMCCAGFAFTLQRGTEWAATGRVTLTEVPPYFPGEERPSLWIPLSTFEAVKTWDFGKRRRKLAALEEALRGASPRLIRWAEDHLLEVLADPEATYAGRQFVMRILRRIGTARCVVPVAKYLGDEKLSHMARFALQHLPYPEVTTVLLEALSKVPDRLKVGMIGSLGERGDPSAIEGVAPYVKSANEDLARVAIRALGRIGGEKALEILLNSRAPRSLRNLLNESIVACARSVARKGGKDTALKVFRDMARLSSVAPPIRLAAYGGILECERGAAVPELIRLLKDRRRFFRNGAKRLLLTTPGADISEAIGLALKEADKKTKLILIDILRTRGDKVACPAVLRALGESPDERVCMAAVEALAAIGTEAAVEPLLKLACTENDLGRAARSALAALRGPKVDVSLSRAVRNLEGPSKAVLLEILVSRRAEGVLPLLFESACDRDPTVRKKAYNALASLTGPQDFEKLMDLYIRRKAERPEILKTLSAVVKRLKGRKIIAHALVGALRRVEKEAKAGIVGLLPLVGTPEALEAVREAGRSGDPGLVQAAVEALAAWPTQEPLPDLKRLVREARETPLRRAAFKGYVSLLCRGANRPARETVKLIEEALGFAQTAEERKVLIEGLRRFPCREALELATQYEKDPAMGPTARATISAIRTVFANAKLSATASHNSGEAFKAFDKRPETRWTTNTPMRPGMWFVIDLGREQAVKKIVLDTRRSPGDYPRGSEIYVSFDGKTWGRPVLVSKPQGPVTVYEFKKPLYARFIKIVQTGSTQGLYWSIHELTVEVQ